jgi:hypothetical protein
MIEDQLNLNEFEIAILDRLGGDKLAHEFRCGLIRASSRHFTGAGSYTDFDCPPGGESAHIGLDALINMPSVPNGMGAVLFMKGGHPRCLEVYTYGGESWDGSYEGFSIEDPG